MKKIETLIVTIVILFLSIHLFTIHSKLLFHLNPDKTIEYLNYRFSLELFSQGLIVSTLSALAYSLITASILTIFVKYKIVFIISVVSFSILDAVGVFVYYNVRIDKELFVLIGSVYYSLYTMFIVVSLGMFRNIKYHKNDLNTNIDKAIIENDIMNMSDKLNEVMNESLDEKVYNLYTKEEMSQTSISKQLDISQPTVSRILKKFNNKEIKSN